MYLDGPVRDFALSAFTIAIGHLGVISTLWSLGTNR
jgi:hypothetical protein